MQTRESLLDTIQRLLALGSCSKNPNQHEAAAAVAKAHELMERYNIAAVDLGQAEGRQFAEKVAWHVESRNLPFRVLSLATLLERHWHVRCMIRHAHGYGDRYSQVILFGSEENTQIARYVLVYLLRTAERLWKEHRQTHGARRGDSDAFYEGLVAGFHRKLEASKLNFCGSDRRALAVVDENLDEALKLAHPDLRPEKVSVPKTRNWDAFLAGHVQGGRLEVPGALGREKRQMALGVEH